VTSTNQEEVSEWRSEVIEGMINVEWLMNAVICQHYFKLIDRSFWLEVLYNEQFSFGLRRSIVERIVREDWQDLRRMGTIRNLFAHCGLELTDIKKGVPGRPRTPSPRDPEKDVNFAALVEEFRQMRGPVEQRLLNLYQKKGGKFTFHDSVTGREEKGGA
jgi:hypothetical protein